MPTRRGTPPASTSTSSCVSHSASAMPPTIRLKAISSTEPMKRHALAPSKSSLRTVAAGPITTCDSPARRAVSACRRICSRLSPLRSSLPGTGT